jgi:hypothetical protein
MEILRNRPEDVACPGCFIFHSCQDLFLGCGMGATPLLGDHLKAGILSPDKCLSPDKPSLDDLGFDVLVQSLPDKSAILLPVALNQADLLCIEEFRFAAFQIKRKLDPDTPRDPWRPPPPERDGLR